MASFEGLLNINFFLGLHNSITIDPLSIENINLKTICHGIFSVFMHAIISEIKLCILLQLN